MGLKSPADALKLFEFAAGLCGTALTGFELMPRIGVEFTTKHIPNVRDPLSTVHPWYALIDISTSDAEETAERMIGTLLETAYERGLIDDAVIAASEAQRKALWHMRESMSDAQKPEGGSIKHDVSVPVSQVPVFMAEAEKGGHGRRSRRPHLRLGHLGDGNIHYNISQPSARTRRPISRAGAR